MRNINAQGLIARIRLAFLMMLALAVAGCGGGGGGGSSSSSSGCATQFEASCGTGTGTGTGTATATPAQLSLILDTPTIQTDGSSEVAVSATVKDSKNNVISGVGVTFSADSGTLSVTTPTTGTDGIAKAVFNSNDNKTNRTVTITATAGALTQTTTLVVQGTRLGFGGDASAVRGKTVSMTVTLLDGAGKAVVLRDITLTSKLGNPVPASVKTDTNGQASVSFAAAIAGADTITASALGAVLTQGLAISAVDFAFASPEADSVLPIGTCQPVKVQLNGVSAPEAVFSVSRGKVFGAANCSGSGSDLQTIAFSGGSATAYVMSSSAGAATVLAELSGGGVAGRASLPVKFVATTPSKVIVQSDPSVVAVNGSSSITALVKDVAGNPVSGETVVFTASGGGVPSPTTAVTNDAGVATTTFKADSSISGKDSVVITASVQNGPSESSTLTVAGKAVNIVIGTDNKIVMVDNPPRYRKVWGVLVSDPASGPIRNQIVTISLRGVEFKKGEYAVVEVDLVKKWLMQLSGVCPAEDANNNGFEEAGEVGDLDDDGLEPNGAAIVRSPTSTGGLSATVTTDDSGAAEFWVEYPRDYASWAKVELMATATVAGKNSMASRSFYLPVPSAEVTDVTNTPSFYLSPFGKLSSCNLH